MMQENFSEFITHESLFQFKWDASNMKSAMAEIVNIFKKQQKCINNLNDRLNSSVNREEHDELKSKFNNFRVEIESYIKKNDEKIKNVREDFDKNLFELRDWAETANATVLVDVKREISQFNDNEKGDIIGVSNIDSNNFSLDEKLSEIKEEISTIKNDILKLASVSFVRDELNSIQDKLCEVDDNSISIKHILERLHDLDGKMNATPQKKVIRSGVYEDSASSKQKNSYHEPVMKTKQGDTDGSLRQVGNDFDEVEEEVSKSDIHRKKELDKNRSITEDIIDETEGELGKVSDKENGEVRKQVVKKDNKPVDMKSISKSPLSSSSSKVPKIGTPLTKNVDIYDTRHSDKDELKLIQPMDTIIDKRQANTEISTLTGDDFGNTEKSFRTINENIIRLKNTSDYLSDLTSKLVDKQNDIIRSINFKHQQFSQDIAKLQEITSPRLQEAKLSEITSKLDSVSEDFIAFKKEMQNRENMRNAIMSVLEAIPFEDEDKLQEKSRPSTPPSPPSIDKEDPPIRMPQFNTDMKSKSDHKVTLEDVDSAITSSKSFETLPTEHVNQQKTERSIKIVKTSNKQQNQLIKLANAISNAKNSTMTTDEIQEKVDIVIKRSLKGFLSRVKGEVQKDVQDGLKSVNQVRALIETKIDRDFVDRMFNKFRVLVLELKKRIDNIDTTNYEWVTRSELEEVLIKFAQSLSEVKDTSATQSKYKCLLCGTPRTHVAGMMPSPIDHSDEESVDLNLKPNCKPKTTSSLRSKTRESRDGSQTVRRGVPRDVVSLITGK